MRYYDDIRVIKSTNVTKQQHKKQLVKYYIFIVTNDCNITWVHNSNLSHIPI